MGEEYSDASAQTERFFKTPEAIVNYYASNIRHAMIQDFYRRSSINTLSTFVHQAQEKGQDLSKINERQIKNILNPNFHISSGYDYFSHSMNLEARRLDERVTLAKTAFNNSELARHIIDSNVVGAHASNSASLVYVQKYGLRPQDWLTERDIPILSGEKYQRSTQPAVSNRYNAKNISMVPLGEQQDLSHYVSDGKPREKESLTNLNNVVIQMFHKGIEEYKGEPEKVQRLINNLESANRILSNPQNPEEEQLVELAMENFPVVYLSSGDNAIVTKPRSDIKYEFGFQDGVPLENIKIILVPKIYVDYVQQMFGDTKFVASLEDYFDNPLFYKYDNKNIVHLEQGRQHEEQKGARARLASAFKRFKK